MVSLQLAIFGQWEEPEPLVLQVGPTWTRWTRLEGIW